MSESDRANEELLRILGLVERGELSADKAEELLAAMEGGAGAAGRAASGGGPGSSQPQPQDVDRSAHRRYRHPDTDYVAFDDRAAQRELSGELRRLRREGRRIAHEARRVARHDLREAMREARHGIEHAVKLGVKESARALEEVRAELQAVFGEAHGRRGRHPRWLANLAGLDLQRDRVKHTATVSLGLGTKYESELESVGKITVRNTNGDVIVNVWDRLRVEVRAEKTAWGVDREVAQDRAEALPVEIQRRNGEVLVDARGAVPGGVGLLNLQRMHTDLVVSVPAGVPLEVTTKAGDVTVRDHPAELSVGTTSGDVRVSGSGPKVKVETVSGDVHLSTVNALDAELVTLSGDLAVDFRPLAGGQYRLRSSGGDVQVRLERGSGLRCEIETVGGDLNVRPPLEVKSRERRKVIAELAPRDGMGDGSALLVVATISGDIRVSELERQQA